MLLARRPARSLAKASPCIDATENETVTTLNESLLGDDNTSRSVTVDGRPLLLVNRHGALFLYENRCPHTGDSLDPQGGSLSDTSGGLLTCQRHGAQFLAENGQCVGGPCLGASLTAVPFSVISGHIVLS